MAASVCLSRHPIRAIPLSPNTILFSSSSLRTAAAAAAASVAVRCSLRRPDYIPHHIPDPRYVRVFDTTLRDGEQSPGATMTAKEKLDIARQLARLGVDVIEAGFPASSDADFDAVRLIAAEVGNADADHVPVICGLARCSKRDIERIGYWAQFPLKSLMKGWDIGPNSPSKGLMKGRDTSPYKEALETISNRCGTTFQHTPHAQRGQPNAICWQRYWGTHHRIGVWL